MKRAMTPGKMFNNDIRRAALVGTLAMLAIVAVLCLEGCGGTTGGNTSTANVSNAQLQPVAPVAPQAQPPAGSQASSMSDDSMPDMAMPDEPAPGADNASQGAVPVQPSSAQQVGSSNSVGGNSTETVVQAALVEWAIRLSISEVPAGKIRFIVTNEGTMSHNLTVQDSSGVIAKTPNFRATAGPQTLEVDLKPGTYTLICSIPGHAKKGQVTTLVVK